MRSSSTRAARSSSRLARWWRRFTQEDRGSRRSTCTKRSRFSARRTRSWRCPMSFARRTSDTSSGTHTSCTSAQPSRTSSSSPPAIRCTSRTRTSSPPERLSDNAGLRLRGRVNRISEAGSMDFELSERSRDLRDRVKRFMREHIAPIERRYWEEIAAKNNGGDWTRWTVSPQMNELKARAKSEGLWNLFLPDPVLGAGLSTLEYAPIPEGTGRSFLPPEAFNCNAPDTANTQ